MSALGFVVTLKKPAFLLPHTPPLASGGTTGFVIGPDGDQPDEEDDSDRAKVLQQLMPVLHSIGKLSPALAQAFREENLEQSVKDIFAKQATATLRTRLGPLKAYLTWATLHGVAAWPASEQVVYAYVAHL